MHVQELTTLHGEVFVHGVRFKDLTVDDRDTIELHCTHHSYPLWRTRYAQNLGLMARATQIVRNARASTRRVIQLPARVTITSPDGSMIQEDGGLLEEISTDGARLLLQRDVEAGMKISFEVPGTALAGSGEVVFARVLESPMSVRYSVGLRLDPAGPAKQFALRRPDAYEDSAEAALSIEVKELAS